jgi:hypothetical protein
VIRTAFVQSFEAEWYPEGERIVVSLEIASEEDTRVDVVHARLGIDQALEFLDVFAGAVASAEPDAEMDA